MPEYLDGEMTIEECIEEYRMQVEDEFAIRIALQEAFDGNADWTMQKAMARSAVSAFSGSPILRDEFN